MAFFPSVEVQDNRTAWHFIRFSLDLSSSPNTTLRIASGKGQYPQRYTAGQQLSQGIVRLSVGVPFVIFKAIVCWFSRAKVVSQFLSVREALKHSQVHLRQASLWRISALLLVLLCVITYFTTSIQAAWAWKASEKRRRPPILPYWLPFFGSLIAYLSDGPRLAAAFM